MKMKTQLSLASIIAVGLLASGCSQMSAQQVAQAAPTPVVTTPAPQVQVRTIVDCSKCARPAAKPSPRVRPRPAPRRGGGNKWTHSHPAIPGCTNSVTHSHPYTNRNHTHKYGCKKPVRRMPAPRPVPVTPWVQQRPVPVPMPVMPKVKAKGTYRGPVQIDGGVMQHYQQ